MDKNALAAEAEAIDFAVYMDTEEQGDFIAVRPGFVTYGPKGEPL